MTSFIVKTTKIENNNYKANGGSIMFVNLSTTDTVTVNGFPLLPNSYFSHEANADEINTTQYSFTFPVGATKALYVHEKIYNE